MDALQLVAERGEERFEIIGGAGPGCFVYRYFQGRNTHDYWQDDLPMAQRCAESEWGVPSTAWRRPMPGEVPLWQSAT
jgi:hypothetical protein